MLIYWGFFSVGFVGPAVGGWRRGRRRLLSIDARNFISFIILYLLNIG